MFGFVAEDVRMPEGELAEERLDDIVDGEALFFLSDLGVENNLQKKVPQLFFHIGVVLFTDGVFKLLRLLKEILEQARVRLLAVPGAPIARTQSRHDLNELLEGVHLTVGQRMKRSPLVTVESRGKG